MKKFNGWESFSHEELVSIAKMLSNCAYGDVSLNFNDIFAFACSYGVDCDEFDLVAVAKLYEKYGFDGVLAWASLKEGVEPLNISRYKQYKEARKHIEENRLKYFWLESIQAQKQEKK